MFRNSIRDGMKFYYRLPRSRLMMMSWKVCTTSTQKRIGIVRHGKSPEGIDARLSEVEDDGEKKHGSETSTAKFWRQTWENRNRCRGEESQGIKWQERERERERGKRCCGTSGKKEGSVRRDTDAVSDIRVTIVRNRHRTPNHPLSHNLQKHEVEVCWDKMQEAEASLRNSIDRRVSTSWKVLAPNHLVSIGILPNVTSISLNRVPKSAVSARYNTGVWRCVLISALEVWRTTKQKAEKTVKTKVQLLLWKLCDSWVVYHRTLSRQNPQRFLGRAKECWNQFDENDSQGLHCVKQTSEKTKVRRYKSNFFMSEVTTLWNLSTDLKKRPNDKSDAPRRTDVIENSIVRMSRKLDTSTKTQMA